MVKVDIEYCGVCNFESQCKDLRTTILQICPNVEVACNQGRQGSFEVTINDNLVYSKLKTLAFPNYQDVVETVQKIQEGKPTGMIREQPIKDCIIM